MRRLSNQWLGNVQFLFAGHFGFIAIFELLAGGGWYFGSGYFQEALGWRATWSSELWFLAGPLIATGLFSGWGVIAQVTLLQREPVMASSVQEWPIAVWLRWSEQLAESRGRVWRRYRWVARQLGRRNQAVAVGVKQLHGQCQNWRVAAVQIAAIGPLVMLVAWPAPAGEFVVAAMGEDRLTHEYLRAARVCDDLTGECTNTLMAQRPGGTVGIEVQARSNGRVILDFQSGARTHRRVRVSSIDRDSGVQVAGMNAFNYDAAITVYGRSADFRYQVDAADFQSTFDIVFETANGEALERTTLTVISVPR